MTVVVPLRNRYAHELSRMRCYVEPELSPASVFRPAHRDNRGAILRICSDLMLPGSGLQGLHQLEELAARADAGEPGMVLAWHNSNFDVPNLYTLLARAGREPLFDRLHFMAGRKLHEESDVCRMFCEAFPRIFVSPPSHLDRCAHDAALRQARAMNLAALRAARQVLRRRGLLFLFPTGTRFRPERPETGRGLPQVDGYLRMVQNFVLLNIEGNTLPPCAGRAMAEEAARPDTVRHVFGPVQRAAAFRDAIRSESLAVDARQAVADAVIDGIRALG